MATMDRLIIFFVPPEKIVNGGILSVFSLCEVSRDLKRLHGAEVLLSTPPGKKSYRKNNLFKNNETVYDFDEIVSRGTPSFLQLHVPEYASYDTWQSLKAYADYLHAIPDLRVNILNQNILLMQPPAEVANWFLWTRNITQTTAHSRYSTQELANDYCTPVHHFSTFVAAQQHSYVPFSEKDDLILFSPDEHPLRERIMSAIKKQFPGYELVTVQGMKYEDYKNTIKRAKFTVTFGEGFDGYYVEGFFTGGITFTVYNDRFFPDDSFAGFSNTYKSYDDLAKNIAGDMVTMDAKQYEKINRENLKKINELYSFDRYKQNVKRFYEGKFTYRPSPDSFPRLVSRLIADKDRLVEEKVVDIKYHINLIKERDRVIANLSEDLLRHSHELQKILNSKSWKLTQPLRSAISLLHRR